MSIECQRNGMEQGAWSKERGAWSLEQGAWSSRLLVAGKICHLSPVTRHLSKIKEKR